MQLMHEKQILILPTSPILEYFGDHAASAAQGARKRHMLDLHAQEFRPQFAAGVPMAIGTDVGSWPPDVGFSFDAWATSKAAAGEGPGPAAGAPTEPGEDSKDPPSLETLRVNKPADLNRDIYYRNKLEFSVDGGWLPINVPFPLDIFVGDVYNTYPLKYTLVPIIASLRWQVNDVSGPKILRGNFDLTISGTITAIPRGPESRYFAYMMGIRRN